MQQQLAAFTPHSLGAALGFSVESMEAPTLLSQFLYPPSLPPMAPSPLPDTLMQTLSASIIFGFLLALQPVLICS